MSSTCESLVHWFVDSSSSRLIYQYAELQNQHLADGAFSSKRSRKKKKKRTIERGREVGYQRLYDDYFLKIQTTMKTYFDVDFEPGDTYFFILYKIL